ncbi:MAG: hypothetical protein LBR80_04215 [Deltaproteobacteria bacterium]|jgi:hypothetical protein|nr:hypothetical protein [Deltaproteobacteria bacterium]
MDGLKPEAFRRLADGATVTAMRNRTDNWREAAAWAAAALEYEVFGRLVIRTPIGLMTAHLNNSWIVRDAKGVFRVCGDARFRKLYGPMGVA